MAYYFVRPRVLRRLGGPAIPLRWPAEVTAQAQYGPSDLFGVKPTGDRSVGVVGSTQTLRWDPDVGRLHVSGGALLASLASHVALTRFGIKGQFHGDLLTVRGYLQSVTVLFAMLDKLVLDLPACLAVETGVHISVEKVTVRTEHGHELGFGHREMRHRATSLDNAARDRQAAASLELMARLDSSTSRYLIAAIYFQQALRLQSLTENRVPELNGAEVIVNLAKALDVLVGPSRDALREGCRALGYTDLEIESQIVPIVLSRNQLDGAHSVAARVPPDLVAVLRDYALRATENVHRVLKREGRVLLDGRLPLSAIGEGVADREKLLSLMRSYLAAPRLSDGVSPDSDSAPER